MAIPIETPFPKVYPEDGRFCVTCAHRFTRSDNHGGDNWECHRPSAPINLVTGAKKYTTCTFERSMSGACGNHGKYYQAAGNYLQGFSQT